MIKNQKNIMKSIELNTDIYLLLHSYDNGFGCMNDKIIGVYYSREYTNGKILEYSKKKGFRDKPNNFIIKKYNLDKKKIDIIKVYLLTYSFENKLGCDQFIIIGVFTTKNRANIIMLEYMKNNNLDDVINFCVEYYIINEDEWETGYFTPS